MDIVIKMEDPRGIDLSAVHEALEDATGEWVSSIRVEDRLGRVWDQYPDSQD